ncbi:recombination protein RecR [Microgenomates group bacterium RBG_16_45_19]|nr:MAG: recombination protein RecR [Microgenomates group bacterium RBG_16_45_19]
MRLPKAVTNLMEQLEKLPGIGPKTAQRLVFYLLHNPQSELDAYAKAFSQLKQGTVICSRCRNVGEAEPCAICTDKSRDQTIICVVEQPLDVLALERSGGYHGLYHVLHGAIAPLNNIGPDQLFIQELLPRLAGGTITEIILATNPTMEGEATAMYIAKLVEENQIKGIRLTRIGRGLPVGGDLEYADEVTLAKALEGRREL